MRRSLLVAVVALSLVGCGGSAGRDAPDPTEAATPTPTAPPWVIGVVDATYTDKAGIGDDVKVKVKIKNAGTTANPGIRLQFSDLDDYADLESCKPECDTTEFFGTFVDLPGVAAGKTKTYTINWVAKAVGVAKWSVCVYDDTEAGNQIGCYDAKTTIR